MRTVHVLVIAILAGTLTGSLLGCGQKGPLVLPDAQHSHRKIGGFSRPAPSPSTPPSMSPTPAPAPAPTASPSPPSSQS